MNNMIHAISSWFLKIKDEFIFVFIEKDRYKQMVTGLGNTLKITAGALLVGIAIGIVVAAVRSTYDKNAEKMRKKGGIGYFLLAFFNAICKIYLTVIRGTPVVVQLMIAYFVIFVSARDGIPVGILAFGINSGAYVAEIFRGGIQAVDVGQVEAARSLGLGYFKTLQKVVLPQAIKIMIPPIINQFITTLKDTSILSVISVRELTMNSQIIIARTYMPFEVYSFAALLYLVVIVGLSLLSKVVERRLQHDN